MSTSFLPSALALLLILAPHARAQELDEIWRTFTGGTPYSLAFSPDGAHLLTGFDDGSVLYYSTANGSYEFSTNNHHAGIVACLTFSADGSLLATGSDDNRIKLWTAGGSQLRTFVGHTGRVVALSFSPDGTKLASASWDGSVRVWAIPSGMLLRTFTTPGFYFYMGVAFAPDNETLYTLRSELMQVWNVNTGELKNSWVPDYVSYTLALSPDGTTLATGGQAGSFGPFSAKLWRASDGAPLHTLAGFANPPASIRYTADGRFLLVGASGNTFGNPTLVRFWRASDGALVGSFPDAEGVSLSDATLARDDSMLAYATATGPVIIAATLPVLPCPGDLTGEGAVDLSDLGITLASFGVDSGGDLDADDDTDLSDLGIVLANFGCQPS